MSASKALLLEAANTEKKENLLYAKVAVDLPINDGIFYYEIPETLKETIDLGSIVFISLGRQETTGFVIELGSKEDLNIDETIISQIKPIYYLINEEQIWDKNFLILINWISNYYKTTIGTVFSASLISEILNQSKHYIKLTNENADPNIIDNEEKQIVHLLKKSKREFISIPSLLKRSKTSKQIFYRAMNSLLKKNIIQTGLFIEDITTEDLSRTGNTSQGKIVLNPDQSNALSQILKAIETRPLPSKTFLLHGVTGSGKTEVYLNSIEKILNLGKSAIYLVPEIYLTPQTIHRVKERFTGYEIVVWHSSLSIKEKIANWNSIIKNNSSRPQIIIGARSAILIPIKNLGLIVIDEAHDGSYKQSSPTPRYDAIKVAQKRSEIEKCLLILGTATPNITDYYKCKESNTVLELPKRIENLPMPKVNLIDMRNQLEVGNKSIISLPLKAAITKALEKKEQIILLLNRRGYASHVFCRACGYIQYCKNCSVPMIFHKNVELLICHHCGFEVKTNKEVTISCPECKSPYFKHIGVGTQQLEEEVKKIFPQAKTIRVDKDQLVKKDQYISLWKEFSSHNADILIGTQLVAKGLDLPNVTVVGVVLADTMLGFPDYISFERAFQLLTQVTGRTGRGIKPGEVFIQTYQSNNPIFQYIENHDFIEFYNCELQQRKEYKYPPFMGLSRIIFQSEDDERCITFANKIKEILLSIKDEMISSCSNSDNEIDFLGPAPCFFTKLKTKHRHHILCKYTSNKIKEELFNKLIKRLDKDAKVDFILDIDSVNLL